MLIKTLQAVRRALHHSPIRAALKRFGLIAFGRDLYNKAILSRGVHEARLIGTSLRFVVASAYEVTHIDFTGHEVEFISRILQAIRPGDVFYDVGGYIGIVTLLVAARHRGDNVTVHAFEPVPRNADHLRRNVGLNRLERVSVHEVGLGRKAGTAQLLILTETGVGRQAIHAKDVQTHKPVQIRVLEGTDVANELGPPDVMKIDVDGAEMEVLAGMEPLLRRRAVRDLFIEVHPGLLKGCGTSAEALEEWLSQRGYRSVWSSARGQEVQHHFRRSDFHPG